MPPETPFSQPKDEAPGPSMFKPTLWKRWLIGIGGAVVVLAVGTTIVLSKNKPLPGAASPTASPAPPVSSSERSKLGDLALGSTQLDVSALTAQNAQVASLLAKQLQVSADATVQGNLTVNGNGVFGGIIRAANFIGSGAGLTGVNAELLNGQPGSYYAGLANGVTSLSSNAALKNAANTFTAANAFNVGITTAGITDSGALTVGGVTNLGSSTISSLILGSPLTVDSGGTGVTSVPAASVLYGQGGPTLGVATPGAAGLCLLSGASDVQWGSCAGAASGVTTLDNLNGVLTLANSSGAGATVTIDDASTAQKGIVQFNATNFSVAAGVANTIQNIAVTSSPTFAGLTLTAPLTVGNGGTGTNTLTANGVIVGGGAGALTSVTAGGSGLCLVSNAGAPSFQACPGSGGVSSVDLQTGAVTIANSSGSGGTVTINNAAADGATKGIAAFNATNFSAASGVINTIQGIATTSSPTFAAINTNTITPSGAFTLGATGQAFTLQGSNASTIMATGGGQTTTVGFGGVPTGAVTYNFDRSAAAGSYTVCSTAGNCTGSGASGNFLVQVPTTNVAGNPGANTISPTGNGIVGLNVNGTSGTAAIALTVTQPGAATAVSVNDNNTGDGIDLSLKNASGTQTNGLLVDRHQAGGTTTNVVNITNTGGTATNALAISGTFTNLINATNFSVTNGGNVTNAGTLAVQGASTAIGTAGQQGSLILNDGNGQTATLSVGSALASNTAIAIPTAVGASDTVCLLTLANCAGAGGGVTGSGSANRLSKFTGAGSVIGDSTITDNGTSVTTTANLIVQGGDGTFGTTSQIGSIILHDGNGQTTTLQAGDSSGNLTFILPTGAGNANQCLKQSGSGNQLIWDNCDGGGGGVSATLQSAYANGNTISTTGSDIGFTLNSSQNFTVGVVAGGTGSTTFSLADGANATPPAQLVLVTNNDVNQALANGITVQSAAGGITDAIDVSDPDLVNAINVGDNTILGTTAVIDFTNFDVDGSGNLTVAGLGTFNGNLTVQAGDTFTVNGDAITDLTGNGLQVSTGSLTLALQASKGLEVDSNGLSLIDCATNEILKYNVSNQWACATDNGGSTSLQSAYNNSTGGSTPEIKLDGTRGGVDIQDADSTVSGSLFTVRASNGAGLGSALFDVNSTGQSTFKNSADSTTAFQVQNAAGAQMLGVDTANSAVIIPGASLQTPYGGFGRLQNLLGYSEQFNIVNTASTNFWTPLTNATVSANSTTGPTGASTADTLVGTGNSNILQAETAVVSSGTYTFSVWLKQLSGAANTGLCIFSAGGTPSSCSATAVTPSSSDWTRFSVTQTFTGSPTSITAEILPGNGSTASVYAWGAQLVKDTAPGVYVPTAFNHFDQTAGTATQQLIATVGKFAGNVNINAPTSASAFTVTDDTNNTYFQVDTANGFVKSFARLLEHATLADAFQVQNGSSAPVFTVDTSGNTVIVGNPGVTAGSLALANGTSSRNIILQGLNPSGAGNATVQFPTIAGGSTDTVCLQTLANCAGAGSVTMIDSQTGAVTINNSSGTGGAITIDNAAADGSTKGIATFNSTNFSASTGVVNTIQNIATTSSPTFTAINTNTITPSGAFTLGATGQAFTLQGNASSTVTATNAGSTTALIFQTPTANANYRFNTAAAGTYDVCTSVGNCLGGGGGGANTALSNLASVAINTDLQFANTGNRSFNIAATGAGTAGRSLTIQGGNSGSGAVNGGDLILQAGATGGSGATGAVTVKANGTDSTTAFQIQNSAGSNMLAVDTTNSAIIIPSATLQSPYGGMGRLQNMVGYSEQFDVDNYASTNYWHLPTNVTVSANSTTAPDGDTTADTLVGTGNSNIQQAETILKSSGTYTFSVWLKQLSGAANTGLCIFSAGGTPNTCTATAVTPSSSAWTRFSVTQTFTGTPTSIKSEILPGNGSTASVYAWGAQLVKDTSPGVYVPTQFAYSVDPYTGTNVQYGTATEQLVATGGRFLGNVNVVAPASPGAFTVADDSQNVFFAVDTSNNLTTSYQAARVLEDSATAFTVQNSAGTSTLFGVDTNTPAVSIGAVGASTSASTIDIADTSNSTGTQTVTIGSSAKAANSVTIQGGTGAGAVSIQAAASGTVSLGTTNANTITVGSSGSTATITVGQSTAGQTINIGHATVATGNTQTINIGDAATGTGKNNVTIGSLNDGSTTTIQGGTGNINLSVNQTGAGIIVKTATNNSVNAFQTQNSSSKNVLTVDTSNNKVVLGDTTSSGVTGTLQFNTSNNANTVTIQGGATAASYTLTLPTAGPATSQCLQSDSVTASQLKFAACTTGSFINNQTTTQATANFNIQSASSASVGGVIQGASSQTADLLNVRDSTGANLLRVDASGNAESNGYVDSPYGGTGKYSNLVQCSEQFDNGCTGTNWTMNNVTAPTADSQSAPNGNTTAESLADSSSGGWACQFTATNAASTTSTFSVWLRSTAGTQSVDLRIDGGATSCATAATVTGTKTTVTATTTWQRFSVTQAIGACASCKLKPFIYPGTTGGSGTVYAWGGQVVLDSVPETYLKTTNSTWSSNQGAVINNGMSMFQAVNYNSFAAHFSGDVEVVSDDALAFVVATSDNAGVLTVDTANDLIVVGDGSSGDPTPVSLELSNGSNDLAGEPAKGDGSIYYNTNTKSFRCKENSQWHNCQGMRDMAERRWGYLATAGTAPSGLTTTGAVNAVSLATSATQSADDQAESTYNKYTSTGSATNMGGIDGPYTQTEARHLPKLVTRIRTDANLTAAGGRMWVALSSASLTSVTVPTGSTANGTTILGIGYQNGVNGGNFACVGGNGTNISGVDTGVAAANSTYYDIVIDYSVNNTLVCSISATGGSYTTVKNTATVPNATSTTLGISQGEILTSGTTARALDIAYDFLEFE